MSLESGARSSPVPSVKLVPCKKKKSRDDWVTRIFAGDDTTGTKCGVTCLLACILLILSPRHARGGSRQRLREDAMANDDLESSQMGNSVGNAEAARPGRTSIADPLPQIVYTDLREWIE